MTGSGDRPEVPAGAPSAGQQSVPCADAMALLAAVFESNAAALVVVAGPELHVERANLVFRSLTARPHEDPAGRRFEEVWPADDPVLLPALRRALDTGEPCHSDDYTATLGGAPRRFSLHVKRVESGGRAALLVMLFDTTEAWRAQRAAEDAANRALRHASELEAVVDALPDAFLLYGPSGEVLRMNETAQRLTGLAPEERALPFAARLSRYRIWSADGRPLAANADPVSRALAGETVRSVHLRFEAPTGLAWVLASSAPIRAPGGQVWGAVLTLSDESEVHALEEARDDLARMISHDLRTPLNAVLAQAHLLRLHPGDPANVVARALSIARSCERMSAMIQDLLEATLLEAGQLRMSLRPVDLAELVPEVVSRLGGALPVERVSIAAPAPAIVAADPERLERILVNLLSNALKYSPAEAPVEVQVAVVPGGATLTVADRGIGIAPEDLPHVFERFFRARGARQPEGLGLGLYITRLLVYAHGGRIDVESYLGTGSAFRVFLPAECPLPTATPPP